LTTFLFWMQKRHFLREIGQCFGELYLKKGYVLFKYINLFFLSMWDQTWLLFIFFHYYSIFFVVSKKGWIVERWWFFFSNHFSFHIFTTVFFSGSDRGLFFLAVWNFNSFNFNQFHFLVLLFLGVVQSLFTKLCTTEIMNAMRWWNALLNFCFFLHSLD